MEVLLILEMIGLSLIALISYGAFGRLFLKPTGPSSLAKSSPLLRSGTNSISMS